MLCFRFYSDKFFSDINKLVYQIQYVIIQGYDHRAYVQNRQGWTPVILNHGILSRYTAVGEEIADYYDSGLIQKLLKLFWTLI